MNKRTLATALAGAGLLVFLGAGSCENQTMVDDKTIVEVTGGRRRGRLQVLRQERLGQEPAGDGVHPVSGNSVTGKRPFLAGRRRNIYGYWKTLRYLRNLQTDSAAMSVWLKELDARLQEQENGQAYFVKRTDAEMARDILRWCNAIVAYILKGLK
jgi:hypothetical protein